MVNKKIGVLMLNTVFPRLQGDIGNMDTFRVDTERLWVEGATSKSVVLSDVDICNNFLSGAKKLQENNCSLVTTSCGFLIKYQSEISKSLSVPFISSSLVLYNLLQSIYGIGQVGVLTASKTNLSKLNTDICNIKDVCKCCEGMEETYFYNVYVENNVSDIDELDIEKLYEDIKTKAIILKDRCSKKLSVILMECTNMAPFAERLSLECDIPVYTLNSAINMALNNKENSYIIG